MFGNIRNRQSALALFCSPPADRQEPRQAAIRFAIRGPEDSRRGIARVDFRADDQLETGFFGCRMRSHDSGQRFTVCYRQRRVAKLLGAQRQLIRMRRSLQKREIRFAM
jgi:hypothetical protein